MEAENKVVTDVSGTRFQVKGRTSTRIWNRKELGVSEEWTKGPEYTWSTVGSHATLAGQRGEARSGRVLGSWPGVWVLL